PSRCHTKGIAGCHIQVDGFWIIEETRVITVTQPNERSGLSAGNLARIESTMLEGFPAHFEQHALLRIHGERFARRHPEKVRVELVAFFQESTITRGHLSGNLWIGIIKSFDVPALARNFRDAVHAVAQNFPE